MNKLLRSPIAAKHRASQAGVLPPGARQFARQTARAVDARARPNGTGPAPLQSAHPACEARRLTTLAVCFANWRPNLATLLHE